MMRKLRDGYLLAAISAGILLTGCQPDSGGKASAGRGATAEAPNVPLTEIGMTSDGWYQVYDQALAQAKASGKPMLIDFTGSDWCGWCIKLDEEVFSTSEFKAWAKDHVVLLKLDFPQMTPQPKSLKEQNAALRDKFKIRGYPTILFVDATEQKIGDYGYDQGGPGPWIKKANEIVGG